MRRIVRNQFIVIAFSLLIYWVFNALTGRQWNPFIVIAPIAIFVITQPTHIWIWQVLFAGTILDITSIHPMGFITMSLLLSFMIVRNTHKVFIRNINAGTIWFQAIITLLLYVIFMFFATQGFEYLSDSHHTLPFFEYIHTFGLLIEIILLSLLVPTIYRWWMHQKIPNALYAKKSLR